MRSIQASLERMLRIPVSLCETMARMRRTWLPCSLRYGRRGQQKRIHQPRKRGRRLNVLGFWQPQQSFEYGIMLGSIESERYIRVMNWQARQSCAQSS